MKEAVGDLVRQENNKGSGFDAGLVLAVVAALLSAAMFVVVAFDVVGWLSMFFRGILGYTAYVLPVFVFFISMIWIFGRDSKKENIFSLLLFLLAFMLVNSAVYNQPEDLSWFESGVYLNSGGAVGEFVTVLLSLGLGSGFALGLAFLLSLLAVVASVTPGALGLLNSGYENRQERNIVTMLADYNDYGKKRVRDRALRETEISGNSIDIAEFEGIAAPAKDTVPMSKFKISGFMRGADSEKNFAGGARHFRDADADGVEKASGSKNARIEGAEDDYSKIKKAENLAMTRHANDGGKHSVNNSQNAQGEKSAENVRDGGDHRSGNELFEHSGKSALVAQGSGGHGDERAAGGPAPKQVQRRQKQRFNLPPAQLLDMPVKSRVDNSKFIEAVIAKLHGVFKSFGVDARVAAYEEGPTITMFEVELGNGVKIAKLQNLSDDIALSLAVPHVRIAPVDGKSNVGIEVPNGETRMVTMREVTDTAEFSGKKSPLSVALGLDISGKPVIGDLATMPHLLVAGSTGSGKSVCINSMILSILLGATPDEVRFIMIDPKQVELSNYNDVPYLLMPVVTDARLAASALNWAVQEMERRYNLMFEKKVRNHKGYNEKCDPSERLPLIVIIVDELADLMMVAAKQVEEYICRIAQKARAAGMHLVVATQRPSVDVITGLIKANIPSRIAFSVSSQVDSRTILDASGAENLLGKGDMLYHPAVFSRPKRVQGVFVSNKEIENVIAFIERQNFTAERVVLGNVQNAAADGTGDDEYLEEAIRFVREQRKASASMLQRKFSIGYNRAARLIDIMEDMGIIGAQHGSKPREVY